MNRRTQRRDEARLRQLDRATRSDERQLSLLRERRGTSARERERLERRDEQLIARMVECRDYGTEGP